MKTKHPSLFAIDANNPSNKKSYEKGREFCEQLELPHDKNYEHRSLYRKGMGQYKFGVINSECHLSSAK